MILSNSARDVVLPGQVRIYARKSVAKETKGVSVKHDNSIREQITYGLQQCQERGLPIGQDDILAERPGHGGDEFWEGGDTFGLRRGKNARTRPQLTRLVNDILDGLVKVVVVWDHARLWRSTEISGALIQLFHSKGVELLDNEGFADLHTDRGREALHIEAAGAQKYREQCVARAKRRSNQRRRDGMSVCRRRRLGFRSINGKMEFVADEIALIRRIYAMYVHGENGSFPMSPNQIAAVLQADSSHLFPNALTPPSGTPRVSAYAIRYILRNITYIGKQKGCDGEVLQYDAEDYLVDGKPVIDADLWVATRRRELEVTTTLSSRGNRHQYACLIRCGVCARTYQIVDLGRDGHRSEFAFLKPKHSYHQCTHHPPTLFLEELDSFFKSSLAPLLISELVSLRGERTEAILKNELTTLRLKRESESQRLSRAITKTMSEMGPTNSKLLQDLSSAMNQILADLDYQILRKEIQMRSLARELGAIRGLDHVEEREFRSVVRDLIKWIAVFPSGRGREHKFRDSRNACRGSRAFDQGTALCLTTWGTYITAKIEFRKSEVNTAARCRRNVLRCATPSEVLTGICDLPEPQSFFDNLAHEIEAGKRGPFEPEEWTPGFIDN